MADSFENEKNNILSLIKEGINCNFELFSKQKQSVKKLLFFALMNAANNKTVTKSNFQKLVSKIFKSYLIKLIKDALDDDDWDDDLLVEINKIIASEKLLKKTDLNKVFTPEKVQNLLKKKTSGKSVNEMVKLISSLRDLKTNHRETPDEFKKRERNQRIYVAQRTRERAAHTR